MEATVVCIDNSEWTRNGDYAPTRFQAQADAVNLLAGAKTEANPENTVGVLTMAGKSPRVLVTPTPDLGKILNSMQVGTSFLFRYFFRFGINGIDMQECVLQVLRRRPLP